MDKDRSKLNESKNTSCAAGRCKKPDTCIHIRGLRQQHLHTGDSAQVLYRGPHYQANRSDEELFYDCYSISDTDYPREGKHGKGSCKSGSTKTGGSCKDTKYDNPEEVRAALERANKCTQMLLKNFESNNRKCRKPCNATLEITARLITDPKANAGSCLQGRAVTVQMPLEFDPHSGQLAASTPSRHICNGAPREPEPHTCKGNDNHQHEHHEHHDHHGHHEHHGHHDHHESHHHHHHTDDIFVGSCTPSFACICKAELCPNAYPQPKEEVPVILPIPIPLPVTIKTPSPTPTPTPATEREPEPEDTKLELVPVLEPATGSKRESLLEKDSSEVLETATLAEAPIASKDVMNVKRYYLALPQHREFSNCSPCRFEPSPIMDEDGNVFCPGNCGCCQCPWKRRSFDENLDHVNVKVCRCVQRGTIFSSFDERETCSQTSYFDFCPCREKAEAKFLELYHCEMWSAPNVTRGREIQLEEIKELKTPPQPRSS